MKDKYIRLKAMLLAGTIAFTGATLSGCSSDASESVQDTSAIVVQNPTKHFGIGEHIISVPLDDSIRSSNQQYEYHPGYEPVGISITGHGDGFNFWGGGAILYVNTEEVDCSISKIDRDGTYLYLDFGTPTYDIQASTSSDGDIKEFGIGEHIISIPLDEDNRSHNVQYEYHDGYEVVGIATSAHGDGFNFWGGGALLYKNVVPVKCVSDKKGYTTFGTPIENEKTKVLN